MLRLWMIALAGLAALAGALPASADTNALTAFDGGVLSDGFTGTYGWEFSVNSTITVTQLGFFDDDSTLLADHEVAVFDTSGKVYALGTVSPVPHLTPSLNQLDYFTYVPVTFSSPLVTGTDYVVAGGVNASDNTISDDGFTPITVDTAPELTFVGDRFQAGSGGLTFPGDTSDPALEPVYSYFGPDFQFVDGSQPINAPNGPLPGLPGQGGPGGGGSVPEPGPMALLALGLPALLTVTRHRRTGAMAD